MISRRTLAQSMLAGMIGVAMPRALSGQTPAASPVATSGIQLLDVSGMPLALSPDGTMIASFGEGETIVVKDTETLEIVAETDPQPELSRIDERSLTWSPDGSAIAWSLNAARLIIDSDIFVFDLASGTVTNLTNEEPTDKPAVKLIGEEAEGYVLDVDVFPTWSPDGQHLVVARSVSDGDLSTGTTMCRIPRDGGDVTVLGPVSPDIPLVVSSIQVLEDDSLLYTTWPPKLDDPTHGVFRMSPDGVSERISSDSLNTSAPYPILLDVAPAARKASIVSHMNYGMLDTVPGPIWGEIDLDTGELTDFAEILVLPVDTKEASREDRLLIAAPSFLTNADGDLTGYLYATAEAGFAEYTLWHHDPASGEAASLGTFRNGDRENRRPTLQYSRIETGTNGIAVIFHGGQAWLANVAE